LKRQEDDRRTSLGTGLVGEIGKAQNAAREAAPRRQEEVVTNSIGKDTAANAVGMMFPARRPPSPRTRLCRSAESKTASGE